MCEREGLPARTAKEKMCSERKWLFEAICAAKAEITDLEYEIKNREQLLRKQNGDVEDAFSRYMDLTRDTCEGELDRALKSVADSVITRRIERLQEKFSLLKSDNEALEREIGKVTSLAETVTDSLKRMRDIVSAIDKRNNASLDDITRRLAETCDAQCETVVIEKLNATRKQLYEKIAAKNERISSKNQRLEHIQVTLSGLIDVTSKRISQQTDAIRTLENQILHCMKQKPRVALQFVHCTGHTIAPISDRAPSNPAIFGRGMSPFGSFNLFRIYH